MAGLKGLYPMIMFWAVSQLILTLSNVPESSGLTYEELVMGLVDEVTQIRQDPVIPHAVQADGNVSVAQSSNGMVTITFKGLPNHATMMVNPNDALQQDFQVTLPEDPAPLDEETCLSGGAIGWTIYGVALYNPYNALGTNAVEGDEAETFDSCQGHPDNRGSYHYHQLPDICVFPDVDTNVHGIALDGFPIYGPYKEDGTLVQEEELDKCHGRCGDDGKYRYHMTKTFPYILGCFRGTPMTLSSGQGNNDGDGMGPPPGGDGMGPPPDGRSKRQVDPNQCAYNTVQGENYEFQTCSSLTGTVESGVRTTTEPLGGGSGHLKTTITLVLMACAYTWTLI